MKTCGEACDTLSSKQFEFHLQALKMGMAGGPSSLSECARLANYSQRGSVKALSGLASQIHGNTRMQVALQWHRDQDSKEFSIEKEEALRMLLKIAKSGAEAEASASDSVRAIGQMGKMLPGWLEPEKHTVALETIDALLIKAKGGDKDAAAELRRMKKESDG